MDWYSVSACGVFSACHVASTPRDMFVVDIRITLVVPRIRDMLNVCV